MGSHPGLRYAALGDSYTIGTSVAEPDRWPFDISARAAVDRSLVASDGLHPSGAQYALWVARIAPVVAAMLAAG